MFGNLSRMLKYMCFATILVLCMTSVNVTAMEMESPYSVVNNLTNMMNEGPDEVYANKYYEATLVPEDGYLLPDHITILVSGQELKEGWAYMYSSKTGELVIYRSYVKGKIEIIGEAVQKVYGMSLNFDTIHFSNVELDGEGNYEENEYEIVTITNTGNCPIEGFTVASNAKESAFLVLYESERIKQGQTSSFCVEPKTGLLVGDYNETILLITEEGLQAQVTVSFKVRPFEEEDEINEQGTTELSDENWNTKTEEEESTEEPQEIIKKEPAAKETKTEKAEEIKSPKTGDHSIVWWFSVLILVAGIGCGMILCKKDI